MFSLLIEGNELAWETDQLMRMDVSRFNEYSGEQAESISLDQPDTLHTLELHHAFLMYELGLNSPNAEVVRVGRLRDIRVSKKGEITFRFDQIGQLQRNQIQTFADRLNIESSEFGRTHWSIKDGEIPAELLSQMSQALDDSQIKLLDRIVDVLVDGNEEQRANVLSVIQDSTNVDHKTLATRLRLEITERFSPKNEKEFASAVRATKKISSIRSWMLSSLIWCLADDEETQSIILNHLQLEYESDSSVRYWTLAGLYQTNSSFLSNALSISLSDEKPEIRHLASAINSNDPELIEEFRGLINSGDFETAWPVLRVLRVVSIPELAPDVCTQFIESEIGSAFAYDALYALTHPKMAQESVEFLEKNLGVRDLVERVIAESHGSNQNALRNFAVLIAAFEQSEVLRSIEYLSRDPQTASNANSLKDYLAEYRRQDIRDDMFVAGYASDAIDIKIDDLDIRKDVQTLTAVMLAKEVKPPLAIGLFGDWGAGKSYFMKSMKSAGDKLATESKTKPDSKFCANIASIEFNAWHYVDTNLWASLVSVILDELDAFVTPRATPESERKSILSELASAKAAVGEAEQKKKVAEAVVKKCNHQLQSIQEKRGQLELRMRDLSFHDVYALLKSDDGLKSELVESLDNLGVPSLLGSIDELSEAIEEAHSIRGRMVALFSTILNSWNIYWMLGLLIATTILIPSIGYLIHFLNENLSEFFLSASVVVTQITALLTGTAVILSKAMAHVKTGLQKISDAKQKVDRLIATKRSESSANEVKLQSQIATLVRMEQAAKSRLTVATERVFNLEERLRILRESRTLSAFLSDRANSEDYRKHLGLISTIRQDFENLAERLSNQTHKTDDQFRQLDRIVLYIDDLDRCPTEKVLEVLQAVHLLLAYPLFVVVVGVDPRWLLHALNTHYSAFESTMEPSAPSPQNYLEKIFQIPFILPPMSKSGYSSLVKRLLVPDTQTSQTTNISNAPSATGEASELQSDHQLESLPPNETSETVPEEFAIYEGALTIKHWEGKFASRLFELVRTPRMAKRLSNLYRLLKAPIPRNRLPKFEGTSEFPGEFQLPMLLLAIQIFAPSESVLLFRELNSHAQKYGSDQDVSMRMEVIHLLNSDTFKSLKPKLEPILSDSFFPSTSNLYREWLPKVSRFSLVIVQSLEQSR